MADATQDLMLRVRGDNSGVDKAVAGTERAVKRLSVSGEKAGAAFKNFSRSLAEARDASDVASSAANSLSNIVGKSLVGAVAVGAVKIFTDQITRMGEMLKETATNAQKSFDDIEKAGQAMSLSEAIAQTSAIDANIASINNKLTELNRSPFQNFIAGATGARSELEALVKTQQRLRDVKLAEGITSENANDELLNGLDAESKKLYEIDAQYRQRSKLALSIKDPEASAAVKKGAGEMMARQRNAILDKQAKDRTESQIKFDKMVFDAEQKLADQSEAREKKTEQERVQRKIDNNNRIYREERYDLDEKIKMETDADDIKFQRLIRDANKAREQQKRTQQTATENAGGLLGASKAGRQELDTARKLRARKVEQENFKTQEKAFQEMAAQENVKRKAQGLGELSSADVRRRVAEQQAAGEMPSLGERLQGGISGVDPTQIAREATVASQFQRDVSAKSAFAQQAPETKVGQEQSTLAKETLQAIQSLVDLMKSGAVVR
jgi:hypothetical protein